MQLREAERLGWLELVTFDAEPTCWRRPAGPGRASLVVKPDAYVCVAVGDYEEHRFFEVDLGTESLNVISQKADLYVRYWHSGQEQRANGVFPQVLFLVSNEHRAELIVKELARQPADHWRLFQTRLLTDAVTAISGDSPRASPTLHARSSIN